MSLLFNQSSIASFALLHKFSSNAFLILEAILSLIVFAPINIPSPYSALSSNNELAHAGPWPSWFFVYAVAAPEDAHIEEHPVAFAITILSPNNWVTNLAYGVSPQPAHAPENSKSGCSNWLPLTVFLFIGFFLFFISSTA